MGIACLVCIVVGLGRFSDAFLFISIACGLLAVFFATEKGWRSKIAVALLAISIGGWMFSPVFRDGFSLASLILAFVAYSYTTEELGSKIGVGLSALTILLWLMIAISQNVYWATIRAETEDRFKKIVLAFNEYRDHQKERRLPPAALTSRDGQPLLSWRVILLPYLDHKDLFSKFHLDEPWDSTHNKTLLPLMPDIYAPPAAAHYSGEPHATFCQVFTGPGTPFDCPGGCRLPEDFLRGSSNTILVVEAGNAVPWTKPEDLIYAPDQPLPPLGGPAREKSASFFFQRVFGTFSIGFADGHIDMVSYPEHVKLEKEVRRQIIRIENGK